MDDEARESFSRGSTNEETRQRNLALMLASAHREPGITRSELTHRSGLNRSTVGQLVAELVDLDLVIEVEPSPDGTAGRPSPTVIPHPDVMALSVNPDVMGVTMALVGLGGRVVTRETVLTPEPASPSDVVTLAKDFLDYGIGSYAQRARLAGVCLAIPGLVDSRSKAALEVPAMSWSNVHIASLLEEELALPVTAANDATVGVLAESMFGAAAGLRDVIYLNGSIAGLGGGVFAEGHLIRGHHGMGGELGHLTVVPGGILCACGRRGCLETEINVQRVWEVLGVDFLVLDDLDFVYATDDSPKLQAELDRQAAMLAHAIGNIVMMTGPQRVILGGHVGALLDARGDLIKELVRRDAYGPLGTEVSIVRNKLRERTVAVGAAEVAFETLLSDPAHTPLFRLATEPAR